MGRSSIDGRPMRFRTYIGFDDWSYVVNAFGGNCPTQEPRYVFAVESSSSYDENANIIISTDGRKFQLVDGSHCSCYGFEGQWEPTTHGRRELNRMMFKDDAFFGLAPQVRKWLQHIRMSGRRDRRNDSV